MAKKKIIGPALPYEDVTLGYLRKEAADMALFGKPLGRGIMAFFKDTLMLPDSQKVRMYEDGGFQVLSN